MKHIIFILILFMTTPFAYANQKVKPIEKSKYLDNLRTGLSQHLCATQSPFMKVYKGKSCSKDVNKLFTKCLVILNQRNLIPETITSLGEANSIGQLAGGCISANYMGGEVLDAFNKLLPSVSTSSK